MEVLHTRIYGFQIVQFVVMCREERLRPVSVFMDILHDGPGYGHAVVCGSSSAYLIQKHQRAGRKVVQYHGRLQHLHHESGLAA